MKSKGDTQTPVLPGQDYPAQPFDTNDGQMDKKPYT